MAIFRLSLKTIQRSAGRSSTAAAAYRAGEKITDQRTGSVHDFRRKRRGVIGTALIGWSGSRSELWNRAEQSEKRGNSVVAREVQVALPVELGEDDRWVLALALGEWVHQRYGVAVDVALHAHRTNPHAHLLFTTRTVSQAGEFGTKTRLLDERRTGSAEIEVMREVWATMTNQVLAEQGEAVRIDHRSYARQGRDRESEHADRAALAVETKGKRTEQGERRRGAARRNRARTARDAARRMPNPVSRDVARRAVIAERAIQEEAQQREQVRRRMQSRVNDLLARLDAGNAPQTPVSELDVPTPAPNRPEPGEGISGRESGISR